MSIGILRYDKMLCSLNMTKNSKTIHENYHRLTTSQKKVIGNNNFTYFPLLRVINKHLKKGSNILDIGCGAGTLVFYFANNGYDVHGIDLSKKAINKCRETKKILHADTATFETVDFPSETPSGKYDFILLTEVIEHIPNDKEAIVKISKLLRNKGLLFLTTPSNKAPLHRLGLTKNFDKAVGHERRYSLKELNHLLKNNGFEIKKIFKHESLLRNFFYVFPKTGIIIKFIRGPLVPLFTIFDDFLVSLFGESNFIILAQKK